MDVRASFMNEERWATFMAIDAVVADAYGLTRDQYAHVLSSFSHSSYPKAPELCLARFREGYWNCGRRTISNCSTSLRAFFFRLFGEPS